MYARISSMLRRSLFKRHLGTVQYIWRKLIYVLVVEFLLVAGAANAAPFAYITNAGNNTVSVIDTATNAITATVAVGSNPYGVAVHPNGSRVYVTNAAGNSLSVIDTMTNAVTANVAVGSYPNGVAVHPNGSRVYVANEGSNALSVIDTVTNAVTDTVSVSTPHGVAVHPNGSRVYVTNMYSDNLSVIDAATNVVIDTVPVGSHPSAVAVHPSGSRVYVTNAWGYSLSVIDTATNTVTATVAEASHHAYGVAVHPNGSRVYVSNNGATTGDPGNLCVIDTATNAVIARVGVGRNPLGVAVHPNGSRVYVVISNDNSLSVINTATNAVIATMSGFSTPASVGNFIGPEPTSVEIDIKPGSDVNPINPDSQGRIAVAIVSTATFDATHVDTSTLHFGTATVVTATVEDVNGDGRPDIVLHFNTTDVGIACGDTSATLIGFTLDGQSIQGSDLIRTVGCK